MVKAARYCIALLIIAGCGGESPYRITVESQGTKIVVGKFTQSLLESDSSFSWYRHNYDAFTPDSASIAYLSAAAQNVRFIVFGGTWCSDTKRELPKFFKTVSLSHMPETNIELYGVDRSKNSNDGLTEKYGITRVPTFILFSDGKEIGRIVESTKNGMEFDLAGLVKKK
jgi:thiol-disulfide isomerase/thioredoxin